MPFCYVCGREINYLAWAKHVAMEKRKHGENIYRILKAEREKKYDKSKNKRLNHYGVFE